MDVEVQLAVEVHLDGRDWIACCRSIDVTSQARTKASALRCLQEAIELWFESCISRRVLEQALSEAGFHRGKPGEEIPEDAVNIVRARTTPEVPDREPMGDDLLASDSIAFRVKRSHGQEYLEGFIPAMIAGDQDFSYASV